MLKKTTHSSFVSFANPFWGYSKLIIGFLMFLLSLCLFPINTSAQPINPYSTWYADDPQIQLEKEGEDDQIGMGRVFVPAMSKPKLEPGYSIYQDGKMIESNCPVGKSVFLKPGKYTLYIGSATSNTQQIKEEVLIENGQTVIVPVNWSGLIIKIIDQNRDYLREPYEIYAIDNYKESIGMKYSADEDEPGEEQETWCLKPGLYKVIKYKEAPKTFINFSTIQLLPYELSIMTIVIDNTTRNFIGAGILPEMTELGKEKVWKKYTSITGNFFLSSDNSTEKNKNTTNITLGSKLENELKLDKFPHYFNTKQILNIGFSKEQNQDFRIYSNNLQIPTTYIYYFVKSFGIYSRFRIDASIFPTNYYYASEKDTIKKYYTNGNIDILTNTDKVKISPMFFPIKLEEGLGLNLSVIKTNRSDLNIKTGFGLSQTFNNDVFEQDKNDSKRFNELESVYLNGIEGSVSGDFRISNNVTYIFEIYTLQPFEKDRKQTYRIENTITFRISSFISLDYTLSLNKDETKAWTVQNHNLSLNFTFISF